MLSHTSSSFSSFIEVLPSPVSIASNCWSVDILFPRVLCQEFILSMDVWQNHISNGGEVVGCLRSQSQPVSIGIIASTWAEWLPALQFVPIKSVWVWITNNFWEHFLKRLFLRVVFISGPSFSLPPVNVLPLSQITLGQYNIDLHHCPASIIISTSRIRVLLGWIRKFWRIFHADVGGCTDGH